MNWEEIVGQKKVVETLKDAIDKERVGHAQLFIGEEGFGVLPLALAYAKEILSYDQLGFILVQYAKSNILVG